MVQTLSGWLVQQPLHILLIAAGNLALWAAVRKTALRRLPRANVFWVSALAWLAYAAWEWAVTVLSPDADIRFDLLLIWPCVGLATLWAVVRAVRGMWSVGRPHRGPP
jgi:hypothetical protein